MAKLIIGPARGKSTTKVHVQLTQSSEMVLSIGEASDMAIREVNIIESNTAVVRQEILHLKELLTSIKQNELKSHAKEQLDLEAMRFTHTTENIINDQKWYTISARGLIDAARAIGQAADPIVESASKILDLLKKATSPE